MAKAVIFDFDGVIVDSEPVHMQTFREVLGPLGIKLDEARWYAEFAGTGSVAIMQRLFSEFNVSNDVAKYVELRKRLYRKYAEGGLVKPKEHLVPFLQRLKKRGIKMAIASGSHRSNILPLLSKFNISDFFEVLVSAEDTERKKPNPEPFLTAAHRLVVPAVECIVIEDSVPGVNAAKAAGMQVVLLHSPACKHLNSSDAIIIDSFSEFPFGLLG